MAYFLKREKVKEMRLSWYAKSFMIPEVNKFRRPGHHLCFLGPGETSVEVVPGG